VDSGLVMVSLAGMLVLIYVIQREQ